MSLPRISIITPSYNQALYLERTICSVLSQNYPNLEYIVIDGGSTDKSVEIIKKYANRLSYWISEPDHGQAHAINKGLQHATGEWVGWQNSDDIYYPDTLTSVIEVADRNYGVDLIIGNMNLIDKDDQLLRNIKYVRPTYRSLLAEGMMLTNQAAFWRRKIHEKIGYLDESLNCGFDYDWFLRVLRQGTAAHVNKTWGGLRLHEETKTSKMQSIFDEEYQRIRQGREISHLLQRFYMLRRMALLLGQGDVRYVLRGLVWRLLGGMKRFI